jgi:hypothetical protein
MKANERQMILVVLFCCLPQMSSMSLLYANFYIIAKKKDHRTVKESSMAFELFQRECND